MKCANCKKSINSFNPFLDIDVCEECYRELISSVFYPKAA